MNRVLALKPSCTRLQTGVATKDKDGPETTANSEPVTEAVSHKARDPSSSEYINNTFEGQCHFSNEARCNLMSFNFLRIILDS